MPITRVDAICGYVTIGRAAEMLDVKMPRVHQLIEEGQLDALALSTHADAKKSVIVLVSHRSILDYRVARGEATKRGPARGSGGRPRKSAPQP